MHAVLEGQAFFWATVFFDFLLVFSFLFAFTSSVFSLLSSWRPPAHGFFLVRLGFPALIAVTLSACFSPPGLRAVGVLREAALYGLAALGRPWLPASLCLFWLAGFLPAAARLVFKYASLRKTIAGLPEAGADPAFEEALLRIGCRRRVRLRRYGPRVCSWGVLHPSVLVPAHFAGTFGFEERLAVYSHELAHLKNLDSLKYLALNFSAALLWFNPVFRRAVSRYKGDLEIARDRLVLAVCGLAPLAYARLILKTVDGQGALTTGFSGAFSEMTRRLSHLFNDPGLHSFRQDRLVAAGCLIFTALTLLGAGRFQPAPAPEAAPRRGETHAVRDPQGRPAEITVEFYWRGILGDYSVGSMKAVGPDASPGGRSK